MGGGVRRMLSMCVYRITHSAHVYTHSAPPLPPSLQARSPGFVLRALGIVRTFSNAQISGNSRTLSGSFTHTCAALRMHRLLSIQDSRRRRTESQVSPTARTLPSTTSEAVAMPQTTVPDLPLYLACVVGRLSMTTVSPASSDMVVYLLRLGATWKCSHVFEPARVKAEAVESGVRTADSC